MLHKAREIPEVAPEPVEFLGRAVNRNCLLDLHNSSPLRLRQKPAALLPNDHSPLRRAEGEDYAEKSGFQSADASVGNIDARQTGLSVHGGLRAQGDEMTFIFS